MGQGHGLRERRKQETRQLISNTATNMFVDHGFDEVTIAQIAEAAGVAKMTVTNHFPRKEDLVLDLHEEIAGGLARAVSERRPGERPFDAVRRDYAEAAARQDPILGYSSPGFATLVQGSPVLLVRLRELFELRERALADTLLAEAAEAAEEAEQSDRAKQAMAGGVDGSAADALGIRLAAAHLASVHRVLFYEGHRRVLAGDGAEEVYRALGEAAERQFARLEPAIGGVGRPRTG